LDRRLGGPQSRSGGHGEEKILDPTETRTPTPRSSSPYPVTIPTTVFWLLTDSKKDVKRLDEKGRKGRRRRRVSVMSVAAENTFIYSCGMCQLPSSRFIIISEGDNMNSEILLVPSDTPYSPVKLSMNLQNLGF
jgi:hypothetical protein